MTDLYCCRAKNKYNTKKLNCKSKNKNTKTRYLSESLFLLRQFFSALRCLEMHICTLVELVSASPSLYIALITQCQHSECSVPCPHRRKLPSSPLGWRCRFPAPSARRAVATKSQFLYIIQPGRGGQTSHTASVPSQHSASLSSTLERQKRRTKKSSQHFESQRKIRGWDVGPGPLTFQSQQLSSGMGNPMGSWIHRPSTAPPGMKPPRRPGSIHPAKTSPQIYPGPARPLYSGTPGIRSPFGLL